MTYPALILDTSCLVHRAFHSSDLKLAPLSAKVGRLVSSIHSMRGQFRARMTVAALDLPGRTWRHERSSIYKANRRPKHPDLIELLNVVPSICAGLGIATVSHEGQEADDVIASLVEKTPGCALVTIDKDLYQLMGGADGPAVPGRVHIWHPDGRQTFVTEADIHSRFGVEPWQVPHVQAFWGDASDGIPGCPRVGQKRAIRLIQGFGSVDGVYQAENGWPTDLTKLRGVILANEGQVRMSLELATLRRDLDVTMPAYRRPDEAALGVLAQRFFYDH